MTGPLQRPSRRDFLRRALGTLVAGPAAAKAVIEAPAIAAAVFPKVLDYDVLAIETYSNFSATLRFMNISANFSVVPHLASDEYVQEFAATIERYMNRKSMIPEPDPVLPFAVGGGG